jgi:FMN phosphatase YigB (HAD superfamily)
MLTKGYEPKKNMACKSLVLDVDGVLIRDKHLLEHVKYNCIQYVAKKLPECKDPARVNRALVKSMGHTARGLQRHHRIDVKDFNREVYNVPLRSHLWEVLSSTEFQEEAKEIHNLTKRGWRITLFSNSPIEWTGQVAHAISDEVFVVCPGSNVVESPLKPELSAYTYFAPHHTHIFVDDTLKNLETARWLPNWHPVLFSDSEKSEWCPTIGSLWELGIFTNTVEMEMSN